MESGTDMPNESLRYLKQNLMKHSPGIKRLALNFYGTRMKFDQGMEAITDLILSFKNLESFQLQFFASNCGQRRLLDSLIKKIKKANRFIKDLRINVSTKLDIHSDDMQFIKRDLFQESTWWDNAGPSRSRFEGLSKDCALKTSLVIANNFQALQSLDLMMNGVDDVQDEVCLQLGKGILEKMTYLKSLNLDFSECQSITNNALSLFNNTSPSKRKLIALEQLALNFSGLPNINDVGLKKLGEGISQQFKDLKKLVLVFDLGKEVSDDGLIEFNAMITSNLASLESFTLFGKL